MSKFLERRRAYEDAERQKMIDQAHLMCCEYTDIETGPDDYYGIDPDEFYEMGW